MADTATANFGWVKPEVGSSTDTWGSKVNLDLDGIDALMRAVCPIGSMLDFAGAVAPVGWLLCDGTVYQISAYPLLGAMLKGQYGGDGTTTFGVPDTGGRCVIGANAAYALGGTGGEATHLLTAAEMPVHTHTATDSGHTHTATDAGHIHNITDRSHSHSIPANTVGAGSGLTPGGANFALNTVNTNVAFTGINATLSAAAAISVASAAAQITVGPAGGTSGATVAHNLMQPYIAFPKIIRAT